MSSLSNAAHKLEGSELPEGWRVIKKLERSHNATGGQFSVSYIVQSEAGSKGFLKALDFKSALDAPDPAIALEGMTSAFNFEREVLEKCRTVRMDRVVTPITHGAVRIGQEGESEVVQYLIFELADGDVRTQSDVSKKFDLAISFRSLHHIATGLRQLHSHGIAHQDLKPSNVLTFGDKVWKISDLGCAGLSGEAAPRDEMEVAGDRTYAPPELLYHHIVPDWHTRRLGCDAYLLGSMVVYYFSGIGATAYIQGKLHESHGWRNWHGSFEDVLPYLRQAYGEFISDFEIGLIPEIRSAVIQIVEQLCEPDPAHRGDAKNRLSPRTQFSMERFISRFDLLARRAEYGLLLEARSK